MVLDRPVHPPRTADGTAAPAVAVPLAPGFATYGELAQTSSPNFRTRLAGGKL